MNNSPVLFGQLLFQSPVLLVYVGAIVACTIFWQRCPKAALLALIGAALMFFSALASTLMISYIVGNRSRSVSQVGTTLQIISIGNTLMHAISLALVFAAVFVDRKTGERGFDVSMALPVNEREISPQNPE